MIDRELLRQLKRLQIVTRRKVRSTFSGEYHSAFKGRGMEFEEVRLYNPGDDIRDIDWNVSARSGDLYIKRFREERELTLYILVDLSASGNWSSGEKNRRERAAEIAALLSFSALSNQDRVGLIGFTDEVELFIPPGKGQSHVMALIRKLLPFKTRKKGTNISAALDFLGKVQKRQAIVFLISDFFDDSYLQKLKSQAWKHDLVTLHLYDKREEEIPALGLLDINDPETGIRQTIDSSNPAVQKEWRKNHLERRAQLKSSHLKAGADHGALDISGDWAGQLSRLFLQRQARRQH